MATKTNLINSINSQITAIITQAKHRLSMMLIIDELYKAPVIQDNTNTGTIITCPVANLFYEVIFTKNGNNVNIQGYINNSGISILNDIKIFDIIDSEYLPSPTGSDFPEYVGLSQKGNGNMLIIVKDSEIRIRLNPLGSGQIAYFNFNYKTNL